MTFREQLDDYMMKIGATQGELSKVSGLSGSTISRYRSGNRVPSSESNHLKRIADGLYKLSEAAGTGFSWRQIYDDLRSACSEGLSVEYSVWLANLNFLLKTIGIRGAALSRALNYDPSSISKILSGGRKPADIGKFTSNVASYVVRVTAESRNLDYLASLLRFPERTPISETALCSAIIRWLGSNEEPYSSNPIGGFLEKLDRFNLDDYIKAVNLEDVHLLTGPCNLPTVKFYSCGEEALTGEIDFIRATLLARSDDECILYSDFPTLSRDPSMRFFKLWLVGMSLILRRGLHVSLIIDINRPLSELAIGLEGYLPLVMTGQVNIYYLKNAEESNFCHALKVSGAVIFEGVSIRGKQDEGRFTLTKQREDVRYFRRQAEYLRGMSLQLLDSYRENRKQEYFACLAEIDSSEGPIRMVTGSLPIFTIPEDVLLDLLKRRKIPQEQIEEILMFRVQSRMHMHEILQSRTFTVEFPDLSEEAFSESPICLMLSDVFFPEDVPYTYEAYDAHRRATQEFSKEHPNLILVHDAKPVFRNLTYSVIGDEQVFISKNVSPAIHFCSRNPRLVQLFRYFIPPVRD